MRCRRRLAGLRRRLRRPARHRTGARPGQRRVGLGRRRAAAEVRGPGACGTGGPAGVRSDAFELRLGLLRTARREWAAMPRTGLAATILTAYARGVNDYLAQLRAG